MARVHCPWCHGHTFWRLADGRRRCRKCRRTFTRLSQFRKANRSLPKLVEYFSLGVPGYRLRFVIPLSQTSVQRVFRFFRELIFDETMEELQQLMLSGHIEMDEALFGGRRQGKRGWGAAGKHMVFGIYQRNGMVRTFPVSSREAPTLLPLIEGATKPGSLYYTDDWRAYASLAMRGDHVVVRKEKGQPKGKEHANGIEGFWSYAKTWLYPYRGVPRRYFPLYLKEIEWRFNHRNENLIPLLHHLVKERPFGPET